MKKGWVLVLFAGLFLAIGFVFAQDDIKAFKECPYCGMDREKFGHSRVLIEYEEGSEGLCSLHCAAIDLAIKIDKTPKSIRVGDYGTRKLIDAEAAHWVIGGNKMGVMTKRAKWAFEKKEDAEKFLAENGGQLCSFDEAIKGAYEDMYADNKMIRERRRAKQMKMKPGN